MSTDRKSIAQIKKEFAEAKEGSLEELFAQYAMDERSGVKAVLNSYRKKTGKAGKRAGSPGRNEKLRTSVRKIWLCVWN